MPIPIVERSAQEYTSTEGKTPFKDWLLALRDGRAQAKVTKAVTQMEAGNFGDHKSIKDGHGLYERRLDYGPGYRIYYTTEGDELIILFAGSDKSDQQKTIDSAKDYLADYQARKPKVTGKPKTSMKHSKKKR